MVPYAPAHAGPAIKLIHRFTSPVSPSSVFPEGTYLYLQLRAPHRSPDRRAVLKRVIVIYGDDAGRSWERGFLMFNIPSASCDAHGRASGRIRALQPGKGAKCKGAFSAPRHAIGLAEEDQHLAP